MILDRDSVYNFLREEGDTRELLIAHDLVGDIIDICNIVVRAMLNNRKIAFCGNGGSATLASHMVGEFVGRYKRDDTELPAVSLNDLAAVTAIANDFGYEEIFVRQIKAHLSAGDVVVAFTTSGNSANIIRALEYCREHDIIAIVLTGEHGGKSKTLTDYCLCISSDDTPIIQSVHMSIGHLICEYVDNAFEQER